MIHVRRLPCMARHRGHHGRYKEKNSRQLGSRIFESRDDITTEYDFPELYSITREGKHHTVIFYLHRPYDIGIKSTDNSTIIESDNWSVCGIRDISSSLESVSKCCRLET